MRTSFIALVASVLVLGVTVPSVAVGPVPPPTFPDNPTIAFYYDMWFGEQPAGTAPTGTIVADSGFRPYPNGLPFANYSSELSTNALFFGTPDNELEPMDSSDMRSLYGDGVCVTLQNTVKGGACDLTPVARYWSQYLLQSVAAVGHCMGMAVVTAALFNGQLKPADVDASTLANQSQLTLDTQSQILRQWSTQLTTVPTERTPSQVVQRLIRTLKAGYVPSTVLIYWPNAAGGFAGHAITPYAVFDQGGGQFDIAVYDNNYPGQSRAIHVDTIANTWNYLVSVNPGLPATIAAGDATTLSLKLVDVRDSIATQKCPFCSRVPTDVIGFNAMPVKQSGKINFGVLDLKGGSVPAARMQVLPTLSAPKATQFMLPAVQLVRHSGYLVWVDTTAATRAIPVQAQIASNSGVHIVEWPTLTPGTTAGIKVSQGGAMFSVSSTRSAGPKLFQAFQQDRVHYDVVVGGGGATVEREVERYMRLDREAGLLIIGHGDNRKGSASISVSQQTAAGSVSFRAKNVSWARGQHLALDYGNWRNAEQTPVLAVRDAATGAIVREVPLTRVG